jgi:hypothetical protein
MTTTIGGVRPIAMPGECEWAATIARVMEAAGREGR